MLHSPPRREFELPEEDIEHLIVRGLPWETVRDGGSHWLLLHEYCVPSGYIIAKTTTAIQITPNYPDAPLDMVYFHPAPALESGRIIGALSSLTICGLEFQRWSRHRTPENPWRPGIDNVYTHLCLVEEWLLREVNRG